MDELLDEEIWYGGEVWTRIQVYLDVLKRTGSHQAADMFAFRPETIDR